MPWHTLHSSELEGTPEGLLMILAAVLWLCVWVSVRWGFIHFKFDREKARHRRWWDRDDQ